ncbi:MAG: N-acetyltransferase, partial [Sphingobacteriaceae bacterium]|nr:N-acetyltransferase [Cytophagaceae bacterium]
HSRFVALDEQGIVAGWAALSPVSGRCVYGGVAELSVYVGEAYRGRGVGLALLEKLIDESEKAGLWTLQASIDTLNPASIRLHERAGFRLVGTRERLGQRLGEWRDIVLMERRSGRVG